MKDIAKEQLKINGIGKMREPIVCFKKYEGIFSAVLSILSFKWFTDSVISFLLIKKILHYKTIFINKFKMFIFIIFTKCFLEWFVKTKGFIKAKVNGKLFSLSKRGKEDASFSFDFTEE